MSSAALPKQDGTSEPPLNIDNAFWIFLTYFGLSVLAWALVDIWFGDFTAGVLKLHGALALGLARDVITACVAWFIDSGYIRSLGWRLPGGDYFSAGLCGVALGVLGVQLEGVASRGTLMISSVGVIAICFVGPAVEEVIFRGYLLNWLLRRMRSKTLAILIASALFAAIHPNFWLVLIAGIVYSVMYISRGKQILAPVVVHAVSNATILILGWF